MGKRFGQSRKIPHPAVLLEELSFSGDAQENSFEAKESCRLFFATILGCDWPGLSPEPGHGRTNNGPRAFWFH